MPTPPGPLSRANYLSWPSVAATPYNASADPNNSAFDPTDPSTAILPEGFPNYGDMAVDTEQYHRPLERLHGMGLHAPGVAFDMQIACTIGQPNVTVLPGLALDANGRHIFLAANGSAEINPQASAENGISTPTPVLTTGAILPTVPLGLGPYTGEWYVVVQWLENSVDAGDPNLTQWNDTPWLQLLQTVDPDIHVVLGKVNLDGFGNVLDASYGDPGGLQRTIVSVPAQSLQLYRAITTAAPGADTSAWAEVRAREAGGIEIAVANNSDQVNVLSDAGGSFSSFGVGANQATVGDLANPGITLDGAEATVSVGAPGNYGDVLVYDGNSHLSVSLIGDTGHVIVGGETLAGKVRMLNSSAQDTMSLNGDTGSAVVQRIKAFSNDSIIDVDAFSPVNDLGPLKFRIHGWDLVLDGRSGNNNRALVDWGNKLIVNYAGDYGNGVQVQSNLEVDGNLQVDSNLQVNGNLNIVNGVLSAQGWRLMGNPARKVGISAFMIVGASYSGLSPLATADVDLGSPTQFTACVSPTYLQMFVSGGYNAACAADVFEVDGVTTGVAASGGIIPTILAPAFTGFGQKITFRAQAGEDSIALGAYGIVYFE